MAKKKYKNIFDAIYAEDIEAVKTFLPEQLELKYKQDGSTPLHQVCWIGNTEIARLLLGYGADIEARDNMCRTPLHLACMYGNTETSELLVTRGADPMAEDFSHESAFKHDTAVKDKDGRNIPHKEILLQLRAEYLNKHTIDESERTAALSSGWEMEM